MKRVLVIEDNEDNLYMIKFILEQSHYEVLMAKNGLSGFETALKENPDLILMDIQLPDVNGIEVTKMIRQSDAGKTVPIIAVSSYAMLSDKQKAIDSGCTGYIEKPIDPETIIDKIKSFL